MKSKKVFHGFRGGRVMFYIRRHTGKRQFRCLSGNVLLVVTCLTAILLLAKVSVAAGVVTGNDIKRKYEAAKPVDPGRSPDKLEFERHYPAAWSWLHWWEANRDPYLEVIRQGRGQKPDQAAVDKFRKQAVESLLDGLKSGVGELRASCAIALGRMQEQQAFEPLCALARSDAKIPVRQAAIIAIGLLDTPQGEEILNKFDVQNNASLREAALTAMGLMSRSNSDVVSGFQKLTEGFDPAAAISAWALSRRPDPVNAKFFQGILGRTTNPWVASEAMLSLGRQGKADSASRLEEILLGSPGAMSLPALRDLSDRNKTLTYLYNTNAASRAEWDKKWQTYINSYAEWNNALHLFNYHDFLNRATVNPDNYWTVVKMTPLSNGDVLWTWFTGSQRIIHKPKAVDRQVVIGREQIYMADLRASAAIALGSIDSPASRQALRKSLTTEDDGYSQLYKEMAIISLGQLGDADAVLTLANICHPTAPRGVVVSKDKLDSPLRGFAALALGLYVRPVKTPQGMVDRKDYDKVCQMLADRLADSGDRADVRAACALALGLSGRTENLKLLQAASNSVAGGDNALIGYVILARGMLGDKAIIEPARKYIAAGNDKDGMGVLGIRAAVLGLGLTGAQEVIPTLNEAWGRSYYVNREVSLAMSLCQAYNTTDRLVGLMKSGKEDDAVLAARCLGELFEKVRPQRLGWLINGNNYMIPNGRLAPYQAYANEFLYLYLLPAFGDDLE